MPKIPLVAVKEHVYASKRRKPGDPYEAVGRSDARLMVALGNAREVPAEAPPATVPASPQILTGGFYGRRDQIAESPAEPAKKVAAKKAAAKTTGYRRRDQVADEGDGLGEGGK